MSSVLYSFILVSMFEDLALNSSVCSFWDDTKTILILVGVLPCCHTISGTFTLSCSCLSVVKQSDSMCLERNHKTNSKHVHTTVSRFHKSIIQSFMLI